MFKMNMWERVESIDAFLNELTLSGVLICKTKRGKLTLGNVPFETLKAIISIKNKKDQRERGTILDFLAYFPSELKQLSKNVKSIMINEYQSDERVYNATIEIKKGNKTMQMKMIPSQAIYLALLLKKPVYIDRALLNE